MQSGYIWALQDASVDVEAGVAHVSLLTKVNVCAGRRRKEGEMKKRMSQRFYSDE